MLGKTLDFKRYKGFFLFFLILISFSQFAISGSDNQHKRRLFYACKNLEEVTSDRGKVRALKKLKNLSRDYYKTVTQVFGARISRFFLRAQINDTYTRLCNYGVASQGLEEAYADWKSFDKIIRKAPISIF